MRPTAILGLVRELRTGAGDRRPLMVAGVPALPAGTSTCQVHSSSLPRDDAAYATNVVPFISWMTASVDEMTGMIAPPY